MASSTTGSRRPDGNQKGRRVERQQQTGRLPRAVQLIAAVGGLAGVLDGYDSGAISVG